MKNLKFERFLLGLMVCGGIVLSGCNLRMQNGSCKDGAKLTANWAELKIPAVEGAEVCDCTEKKLSFVHHNVEYFELVQQYAEKFRNDGWLVDVRPKTVDAPIAFLDASKGKKLFVAFHKCNSPSISERFSKCSEVDISEAENRK